MRCGLRGRALGLSIAATFAGLALGTARAADDDAALMALGKTLFSVGAVPPCSTCHALKDAGASGAIGPAFDDLQPGPDRVVAALKSGIGSMPSYRGSLSDEQMRALARYVSKASGGAR